MTLNDIQSARQPQLAHPFPMDAWLSPSSLWAPRHISESAWLEHAPFAYWLMDAIAPRRVVELGTHTGFSYFVWCDAVRRLGIETKTFALDSWEGDEHAGFYGEEVYESVRSISQAEYADFSTLVRGYFDDSLDQIEDGTVDLLHIDGRHGYDDVRHDFEAWAPKLSGSGVVLFHDTAVRERGFGVWKFWAEVSGTHPSFEFEHGHGLGVLAVGENVPQRLQSFLAAGEGDPLTIRDSYSELGKKVGTQYLLATALQEAEQLRTQLSAAERDVESRDRRIEEQTESERQMAARMAAQVAEYQHSTSWKLTRPVRAIGTAVHGIRSRPRN